MPGERTSPSASPPERSFSRRTLLASAGAGATVIAFGASRFSHATTRRRRRTRPQAPGTRQRRRQQPICQQSPPEATQFANDWPLAQGNYAATRLVGSSVIDSTTVGQLGAAWRLPFEATSAFGAITSNPVVVGDAVFIIDMVGNVQSLDRATGAVRWRNDYNVPTYGPNGVAIGYGYLVSVLGDTAEVLCLQADTWQEVWRFQPSNHGSLGITMAPLIYDGVVYVSTEPGGNTKGNYGGGASGSSTRWTC